MHDSLNNTWKTLVLIAILSIAFPFLASRGGWMAGSMFLLITGTLGLISTIVAIVGFFQKKKLIILGVFSLVFIFVSLFLFKVFTDNLDKKRMQIATEIIDKIEQHYFEKEKYPKTLFEIDSENQFSKYKYNLDTLNNTYYLWYSTDGWSSKWYNSSQKTWRLND